MNILKKVLKRDVHPALGCTEPIAIAWASSIAGKILKENFKDQKIQELKVSMDPGVFKNGMGVTIPNSGGLKGNKIAAALGIVAGKSELQLEVLSDITRNDIYQANLLIEEGIVGLKCNSFKSSLYIHVLLRTSETRIEVIIETFHTNLVHILVNGEEKKDWIKKFKTSSSEKNSISEAYDLTSLSLKEIVAIAELADEDDLKFLEDGVKMNLSIVELGKEQGLLGAAYLELQDQGILSDDLVTKAEIMAACATDARMNGCPHPVMSSGGSGNQGIVAILVPWIVGSSLKIPKEKILKSIGLSHLLNALMKCYTGELSPMCGCAIAAGIGATVAVTYQLTENDFDAMGRSINCLTGDIAGMLCDGAKGGCSLKVASAARASIKSAFVSAKGLEISGNEGIVGKTPEETLRNIGLMSTKGMLLVNDTCISLMLEE